MKFNRNRYKELHDLCDRARDALTHYLEDTANSERSNSVFRSVRQAGSVLLNDNQRLHTSVKEAITFDESHALEAAARRLVALSALQGKDSSRWISSDLSAIELHCQRMITGRVSQITIFYSWQSTSPNSTNRSFIKQSLESAAKQLNKAVIFEDSIRLDSDTQGLPGAVEILPEILKKIDAATVFVADVTLIHPSLPNANVMLELGYALKAVGKSKILMIFNEAFGAAKELPFDLGFMRQIIYSCSEDQVDKSIDRKLLAAKLKEAISTILSVEDD